MLDKLRSLAQPALFRRTLALMLTFFVIAASAAVLWERFMNNSGPAVWNHTLSIFSVIYAVAAWFSRPSNNERTFKPIKRFNNAANFGTFGASMIDGINAPTDGWQADYGDRSTCRFAALALLAVLLQIPSLVLFIQRGPVF